MTDAAPGASGTGTGRAAAPPAADGLPNPATALQARFNQILLTQMHDVPLVNAALRVQAVGFRPWSDHWLGVLVTPWFMNLLLLPRVRERWPVIGERESRHYVFPAGVFEFIGSRDAVLGEYRACSLFSPMFDFATPAGAHDTAVAALAALFDAGQRAPADIPADLAAAAPATAAVPQATTPALSKRSFLFGSTPRVPREP